VKNHQRRGGERFGHRRTVVPRVLTGRNTILAIGPTESLFPQNFSLTRHRNRNGGDAADSFLNGLPNFGEIRLGLAAWTRLRKSCHGPYRGNKENSKRKRRKPAKSIGCL